MPFLPWGATLGTVYLLSFLSNWYFFALCYLGRFRDTGALFRGTHLASKARSPFLSPKFLEAAHASYPRCSSWHRLPILGPTVNEGKGNVLRVPDCSVYEYEDCWSVTYSGTDAQNMFFLPGFLPTRGHCDVMHNSLVRGLRSDNHPWKMNIINNFSLLGGGFT